MSRLGVIATESWDGRELCLNEGHMPHGVNCYPAANNCGKIFIFLQRKVNNMGLLM